MRFRSQHRMLKILTARGCCRDGQRHQRFAAGGIGAEHRRRLDQKLGSVPIHAEDKGESCAA